MQGVPERHLAPKGQPPVYVVEDAHWIDAVSESMLADFFTVIRSLVVGKVRAGVIDQCDIKVPRGIRQVGGRTRVSSSGDLQSTDDGSGHDTAVFPVDLDDEGETPSGAAEAEMWAEELRNDSALLVVKRGRNAGARFLLNQPITIAGRLPGSDIFLDDVTVSRRHAEFRTEDGRPASWTSAVSTKPMSTVDLSNRRSWPTATRYKSANSVWCF